MRVFSVVSAMMLAVSPACATPFEIPPIEWLYIETAERASFSNGELVLENVGYEVLAFSDRPHRIAREIDVFSFVSLWRIGKDSFGADAPNAGITFSSSEGIRTAVVELSAPIFDDGVLKFSTRLLSGHIPENIENVSLLVDSISRIVNAQVTDSVTQANVKILGDAPAAATGNLYQATSEALSNAAHNATTRQQNVDVAAQAATTQGVAQLYSIDTESEAKTVSDIFAANN